MSCVRSFLSSKVSQPCGALARFRALSCALSMRSISFLSHGDQTVEAYSRTGLNTVSYILLICSRDLFMKHLFVIPVFLFTLLHTASMCFLGIKFEHTSIPRSFCSFIDSTFFHLVCIHGPWTLNKAGEQGAPINLGSSNNIHLEAAPVSRARSHPDLPSLPEFPGVSRNGAWSPGLPEC